MNLHARNTYTLSFSAIGEEERQLISDEIADLADLGRLQWLVLDSDATDLIIAGLHADVDLVGHQMVARVGTPGQIAGSALGLATPITRQGLMSLLDTAGEQLDKLRHEGGARLQVKRPLRPSMDYFAGSPGGTAAGEDPVELAPARVAVAPAVATPPVPAAQDRAAPPRIRTLAERLAELNGGGPRPEAQFLPEVDRRFPPAAEREPVPSPALHAAAHQAPRPAPPPAAMPVDDTSATAWDEAALTLYSVVQNTSPVIAEVVAGNLGTFRIDFRFRAYSSDVPLDALDARPLAVEVRTMVAEPDWPPAIALPGSSLDKLLWFIGTRAFAGAAAPWSRPEDRYRLQRWPNFTEMTYRMEDMRMTALIGNAFMNAAELAAAAGVPLEAACRMLNAYALMGLLQVQAGQSAAPAERAPALAPPAPAKPRASLFNRLLDKLGF